MSQRLLEASRPITIPDEPYVLEHPSLPFAFVFAQMYIVQSRGEDGGYDGQPTLYPETTMPDSNDPTNDEEIDWLKDE